MSGVFKMYYATLNNKGQITIPTKIRKQLNLAPGDKIEFINNGHFITIIPINKPIRDLNGILPKPKKTLSCEEMNRRKF
jgi:AbrB family looped-hinge helix DNA binding protein